MARRRRASLVLTAVVALLLAGCAQTIAGQPHLAPGAQPAASTSSAPSTTAAAPRPPAVVPGWNAVRSVSRAAVYDVPPDWQVQPDDTIVGYESPDGRPRTAASGAAIYGRGSCGSRDNQLAQAAVKHTTDGDLNGAALGVAHDWADAAYRDDTDHPPTVTLGTPRAITTLDHRPAVVAKAEAKLTHASGPCHTTHGAAWTVAATGFHGQLGPTVVLVITTNEDAVGAQTVPEAQIQQILSTLRPQS